MKTEAAVAKPVGMPPALAGAIFEQALISRLAGRLSAVSLRERGCAGQGGAGAGSARTRLNAATSACAHGQERSSRSLVLRPERAMRPA